MLQAPVLVQLLPLAEIEQAEPILSSLEMWNMVIGFISATFILPVIQQPSWSEKTRSLVTFVYAVLVGGGSTYFADEFTGEQLTRSILLTLISAIATYKGFAKPTNIAPAIEGATSPKTAHGDPDPNMPGRSPSDGLP